MVKIVEMDENVTLKSQLEEDVGHYCGKQVYRRTRGRR
jgi:hypothetical protein